MTDKPKMIEDFVRELEDDGSVMKDLTLVGSDGGTVSASKYILSIRSSVFRRMFYGCFQESSKDCHSVELNYPAKVLRAVVTYCYTNLTDFECYFADKEEDDRMDFFQSDSSAVALVQLRDAANYLELPELFETISDLFGNEAQFFPSTCAILQELVIRGDIDGELWKARMKPFEEMNVAYADESLGEILFPWTCGADNAGICGASLPLLETMCCYIKDNLDACYIYEAVTALQLWNLTHDSTTEEERSKLRKLADSLDLGLLKIYDFEGENAILPCPLYPLERCFFPLLETTLSSDNLDACDAVNILKSWNDACDDSSSTTSTMKDERLKLRDFADKIDLGSINIEDLLDIKPCPLFSAERLHCVLVKTCKESREKSDGRNSKRQCIRVLEKVSLLNDTNVKLGQ